MGFILAILAGCTTRSKEHPQTQAEIPVERAHMQLPAAEQEIPLELLKWVEDSGWDISVEMLALHTFPVTDAIGQEHEERYLIESPFHKYERQKGNSCSGYASAYLLRTLGEDITGQEVYDNFNYKIADGLVLPQGIVDYFAAKGYPVTLYQGSLDQLKARLSTGGAPIVLLVGSGMEYQHYMTLLGYDGDNLYFFDSSRPENPDAVYNSVLSSEAFLPLWENVIPGFERVYFVLDEL